MKTLIQSPVADGLPVTPLDVALFLNQADAIVEKRATERAFAEAQAAFGTMLREAWASVVRPPLTGRDITMRDKVL